MTATNKRSLISESVTATRIDIHPAGEKPHQHIVRVTLGVSRMTIVREVPTKLKLGPYSRMKSLPPAMPGPAVILDCLILPPTNHLEAGRDNLTK
jgi:hypothetical protein